MNVPDDLKYAQTHEWIRIDGDIGTVGITDHAQSELSDVVFVELPEIGKAVEAGGTAAVVESVKAASDIYSPVSGEVVETNGALESDAALINTSPFENGWIFKVKLSDPSQIDVLKSPQAYREQIS